MPIEDNRTFYQPKNREKTNLIVAVTPKKIVHSEIISENINQFVIIDFLKEVLEKMTPGEIRKTIFILDNCKIN